MAKRKSEEDNYIYLLEKDYLELIKDHMTLKALKINGIENMDMYKGIKSIMDDDRIEVHIKPIKKRYK